MQLFDPADLSDSSSSGGHSDDTHSGGGGGGGTRGDGEGGTGSGDDAEGGKRSTNGRGDRLSAHANARRRKNAMNAKERNLRRLESNERERMRMHSLNDAFQVSYRSVIFSISVGFMCGYCFKCFYFVIASHFPRNIVFL